MDSGEGMGIATEECGRWSHYGKGLNMLRPPNYDDFTTLKVSLNGAVATIAHIPLMVMAEQTEEGGDIHFELGVALNRLREDDRVRVIIWTGEQDGEALIMRGIPEDRPLYEAWFLDAGIQYPDPLYKGMVGVRTTMNALMEIEKPVIARVNGDAIGFAQSIMFACDLIVAAESVRIIDHHMGLSENGLPVAVAPGDGAGALVPAHLPPAKANEFLMLAKPISPKELESLGVINYAVPMDELDRVVGELVEKLLQRSSYSIGLTKRVTKRALAQQLGLALDAASGYEWVSFLQAQGTNGEEHYELP